MLLEGKFYTSKETLKNQQVNQGSSVSTTKNPPFLSLMKQKSNTVVREAKKDAYRETVLATAGYVFTFHVFIRNLSYRDRGRASYGKGSLHPYRSSSP
jgi:hypothetical protein